MIKCYIDVEKCEGHITQDTDLEVITTTLSLKEYQVTVYSKVEERIIADEIISYEFTETNTGVLSPFVYWLMRGVHGIPQEYRKMPETI